MLFPTVAWGPLGPFTQEFERISVFILENYIHTTMCMQMLLEALFVIAKNGVNSGVLQP